MTWQYFYNKFSNYSSRVKPYTVVVKLIYLPNLINIHNAIKNFCFLCTQKKHLLSISPAWRMKLWNIISTNRDKTINRNRIIHNSRLQLHHSRVQRSSSLRNNRPHARRCEEFSVVICSCCSQDPGCSSPFCSVDAISKSGAIRSPPEGSCSFRRLFLFFFILIFMEIECERIVKMDDFWYDLFCDAYFQYCVRIQPSHVIIFVFYFCFR